MASQADMDDPPPPRARRRLGRYIALAVVALLAAGLAILWANREGIANNVIASELASRGIDATYKIERIGGRREILTDIVVGDPRHPDLTVERAEVVIRHRFGFPAIASVRLVRPRLFGTYRDGKLSFGELDPLIFPPKTAEPFELPDFVVMVEEGRGLIESDFGPVGVSLAGSGNLRDGFAGEVAATAPKLALAGCEAAGTTLYGTLSIADQRPGFEGPLRLGRLECREQGLSLERAALQLSGRTDRELSAVEGEASLRTGRLAYGANRLAALTGTSEVSWRVGDITTRYKLRGRDLATTQAVASGIALDGWLRTRRNFERIEAEAEVDGTGVRLGRGLDTALADAATGSADTLLGPILERVRSRLASEGRNSRLAADVTIRRTGDLTTVVVPTASLHGGSGDTLLALSRFQLTTGGAAPRFGGDFATGGEGLPRIAGRMDQRPGGTIEMRLSMAEYAAGASRLAVPELVLLQRPDGVLGFSGRVRASGALPGGSAQNLLLPVSGNWSPRGGLALWNACTEMRFDRLQLANLTFERRGLTLCPGRGQPIVRYGASGLRVAAGAPSLQLDGRLGETPIAIRSGAIGFAYPGAVSAKQLLVTLGPRGTASTFAISDLTANIGKDISGRFNGTDVRLNAVAIDMLGATGNWRYADGRLSIQDAAFQLADRVDPARFKPLTAEGATLALEDNVISADALLREPTTGRTVTDVDVVHNLATGAGHADLVVPGLEFGPGFQLALLTTRDPGISNLRGKVTGTGRINWDESGKITSTGRFSSDGLDFAATFGPVRGASGTIEFTDLLALTTAPGQRLRVASVNPGIEVTDGEIVIQLVNGELLALQGATWPFMGGTLTMHAVDIHLGTSEERRYIFEIVGLDASRFVEHMELNNISATGIFDGSIPIVFDASGNGKIEGGLLISRPPGGNVSYVGALTYEDMGAVANFAFDTLRSLDYRQMRLTMDGSLIGEIITRVRLDGVSQGAGAQQNILTRAIAGIPIRLDVNIRAQFYQLISSTRALYDPAAIKDPRDLGLLDEQGNVLQRETQGPPPEPVTPDDLIPDEAAIQRRESEESP